MMQLDGITISDQAFSALMHKYSVKQLALFGSRARGDHRPDSDSDVDDNAPAAVKELTDIIGV